MQEKANKYYLCIVLKLQDDMANINRIKAVLAERRKSNKWLAEQLKKDPATVSKWCTNSAQPSLETLIDVAKVLDVDARELIVPTDVKKVIVSFNS